MTRASEVTDDLSEIAIAIHQRVETGKKCGFNFISALNIKRIKPLALLLTETKNGF